MRSIVFLALLGAAQASPDAAFACPTSVTHRISAAAVQRPVCPTRTSSRLGPSLLGNHIFPARSQERRRSSGAQMSATEAELSAVLRYAGQIWWLILCMTGFLVPSSLHLISLIVWHERSTAIKAGRAAGALMKEKLGAEVIATRSFAA